MPSTTFSAVMVWSPSGVLAVTSRGPVKRAVPSTSVTLPFNIAWFAALSWEMRVSRSPTAVVKYAWGSYSGRRCSADTMRSLVGTQAMLMQVPPYISGLFSTSATDFSVLA